MRPRLKRSRPEMASGDSVAGSGPFGRDGKSGRGGVGSGGGGGGPPPGGRRGGGGGGYRPRRGTAQGGGAAASFGSRRGGAVCSRVRGSFAPAQPSRRP